MSVNDSATEAIPEEGRALTGPGGSPAQQDDEAPRWSARHARGLAAVVVVCATLIALLGTASAGLYYARWQHDQQQRDDAITVAARSQVLALLSLDPADVQGSLDRVIAGSTGGWRDQFAQNADQFGQVVRGGEVRSRAKITASALQQADDSHATVLVSASAMIANAESPQGYPAEYRTVMELENQGGRWLVSDLQFVA
ncbi:hypothetical protein IQ251_02545 [Saccharopolyspora sp. HNM0983]|uniref:Mce-associated membrane protein n=1 Tax=Saccharopolyspora montiporae TaxID=2781240 RepID=A0A929B935_9PSEU|nr:hypothetical protein [Saccharopolyspora sp. HNM0983]MBE9373317.1 hypothetical protein [Saccharopolyspora sp. HNM0983]